MRRILLTAAIVFTLTPVHAGHLYPNTDGSWTPYPQAMPYIPGPVPYTMPVMPDDDMPDMDDDDMHPLGNLFSHDSSGLAY